MLPCLPRTELTREVLPDWHDLFGMAHSPTTYYLSPAQIEILEGDKEVA
jgi:hypothetical protein